MTKELKDRLISVLDKQSEAREYLKATDYIVIKLSEALANGEDLTELKTTYAEQLVKRKEYRASIDTLQVELNALNEELKASEEAKNDGSTKDVIEQPVEEIPNEEPIEETSSEQPIEDTTNLSKETIETEAIEQPIDTTEGTTTEETPITEEVI